MYSGVSGALLAHGPCRPASPAAARDQGAQRAAGGSRGCWGCAAPGAAAAALRLRCNPQSEPQAVPEPRAGGCRVGAVRRAPRQCPLPPGGCCCALWGGVSAVPPAWAPRSSPVAAMPARRGGAGRSDLLGKAVARSCGWRWDAQGPPAPRGSPPASALSLGLIQGSPRSQRCCTLAQGMLQRGVVGIHPRESPHVHPTSRPHHSLPGPVSVGQPRRGARRHPCTAGLGAQGLAQHQGAAGTPRAAPAPRKARQGKEAQGCSPRARGAGKKSRGLRPHRLTLQPLAASSPLGAESSPHKSPRSSSPRGSLKSLARPRSAAQRSSAAAKQQPGGKPPPRGELLHDAVLPLQRRRVPAPGCSGAGSGGGAAAWQGRGAGAQEAPG